MKKILGLDLGSSSIGWAFIEEKEVGSIIKRLGVRVIPFQGQEQSDFLKGNAVSVNKERTLKRTARKTAQRYKLRRFSLVNVLKEHNMMPDEKLMKTINPIQLNALRSKAVTEQVSLSELGRLLFLLNQKRGYKSSRSSSAEEESGKKLSEYLTELKDREEYLTKENLTIGQYFHQEYQKNPQFQTRRKVFPRQCYINEFNAIWDNQAIFYPSVLTEELRHHLRDKIIFFQRRLKSQKSLVKECVFEKGHKVAPKSSPLFQFGKIWESVNTITIKNKLNQEYPISILQKRKIAEKLFESKKLSATQILKLLGISAKEGWYPNEQIKQVGLQGDTTRVALIEAFEKLGMSAYMHLLSFDIVTICEIVDKETGELTEKIQIDPKFEDQPLYKLWHLLYSIDSPEELIKVLISRYGITHEQASGLSKLNFTKMGFGNKSSRAIRKLLPGLLNGLTYDKAGALVGYNHSNSITKEENEKRILVDQLPLYPKNSLRQPIVEKVMNQLVNLVNEIVKDENLGRPDEIRIELARELKQSKEERLKAYKRGNEADKDHKEIVQTINKEFPGLPVTRKVIEKYKLFRDQEHLCIYSGKAMQLAHVLKGEGIDVDHIIPKTKLFDDSYQNKVLVYRKENENKTNSTAFDYMNGKSEQEFQQYIERVDFLFSNGKITRSKRDKLLMAEKDIPNDFINRQLNETRYISKEATKLLHSICRNVVATTGSVTEFLRHQWGYNEVLQTLNFSKYNAVGKVINGKIQDWSKRDDHRHHAIDALIVACTKQSIIQKINTLNAVETRQDLTQAVNERASTDWQSKRTLFEQYIYVSQPFTTQQVLNAVGEILISIKSGKKVASLSRNKANGQITLTPRGQLHEQSVYSKIRRYSEQKTPLTTKFKEVDRIANASERSLVEERLAKYDHDPKKAFKDLVADPIWINRDKGKMLTEVTLWEDCYVIKYDLNKDFDEKKISTIVDKGIREKLQQRFFDRKGTKDHPLKDIEHDPVWLNEEKRIAITSVRCIVAAKDLIPLHVSKAGVTSSKRGIDHSCSSVDYVKTGSNHHIALYQDTSGEIKELTVTFWEAVDRKRLSLPVIVKEPKAAWDIVFEKGIDDQALLSNLPDPEWKFIESLQQNEYFVFNMSKVDLLNCINSKDYRSISPNLYRVQNISAGYYVFRHHLESKLEADRKEQNDSIRIGKMKRISSINTFVKANPIKVFISTSGIMRI